MLKLIIILSALLWQANANFGAKGLALLHNYTRYLMATHSYDTLLVHRSKRMYDLPDFEQTLQHDYQLPLVTLRGRPRLPLRQFLSFNVLAFVLMPHVLHFDQELRDFGLETRHGIDIIFILVNTPPRNMQELHSFFSWCWELNMVNAVLVYERPPADGEAVRVLTYSPFPELHIRNLTAAPFEHYHPDDRLSDLQGYVFNVRVWMDPPTVLLTGNELTGISGLLFDEYVRRLNASYKVEIERSEEAERNALLAPSRKQTHIGINPFTPALDYARGLAASYPVCLGKVCVVVPVLPDRPPQEYLPMVFQLLTPLNLLVLLAVVIALHQLLNCVQAPIYGRIQFVGFLSNMIKAVLSQAVMPRATDSGAHKTILLFVAAFGIIWTNWTVATLTSFLTALVQSKQILTVADFMDSGYRIMLPEYERTIYFESHLLPRELNARLYVVDAWMSIRHRAALNTSYAYMATSAKWNHINLRQLRLYRPHHAISSELCSPILPQSWPVQLDSPFLDSLKIFIMRAHAFGLMLKFAQLSELRTMYLYDDHNTVKPLKVAHLQMAFALLTMCIAAACVVFIGEHVVHRLKLKLPNYWQRRSARLSKH